jgi:hypothetical protein
MLADSWTGGDARPAPYCEFRGDLCDWVEKSYLEGKLSGDEIRTYEMVIHGFPVRFEAELDADD